MLAVKPRSLHTLGECFKWAAFLRVFHVVFMVGLREFGNLLSSMEMCGCIFLGNSIRLLLGKKGLSWAWSCMSVILPHGRIGQEDQEFKSSFSCMRTCPKETKATHTQTHTQWVGEEWGMRMNEWMNECQFKLFPPVSFSSISSLLYLIYWPRVLITEGSIQH